MLKKIFTFFLIFLLSEVFFIWPQNIVTATIGSPLRINEIAPNESSSQDWIEFYVAESGNYGDYVVKERTTNIKTFPPNFNLTVGDFVVLHINQTGVDETTNKGSNGYWDLYSSDTGLIGTDNVIILEDSSGNIVDAVSFANNDGTWATTQQMAFNNAIAGGQWTGTINGGANVNEAESADWSNGGLGLSLGRDETSTDTDNTAQAKNDWTLKTFQTMGFANIENEPPEILEAKVSPPSVPADGKTEVLFTAKIFDPQGLSDISEVYIDLSEIGGDDTQEMHDDGNSGDAIPSDGIFSFKTTIPTLIPPKTYNLSITAVDSLENEAIETLTLDVTKPTYSKNIALSEILPDPQGDDQTNEFIELKNTGNETVDLQNWKISDTSTTYTISQKDFAKTTIPALGYFVIYRSKSGIALNNTGGDQVKLYQPDGTLLDSVSYTGTAFEGQSYNFYNNSWVWSTTITPGSPNQITKPNHNPEADAGPDKSGKIGEKISFSGLGSKDPDNDNLIFTWDFGDGNKGSGAEVTHIYSSVGSYTVTLTVNDGKGGTDSDTAKVTISENEVKKDQTNQIPSGPFSKDVIINEILPNPEGSDSEGEFVELYNKGNQTVDLNLWQLDDENNGSAPYTIKNKKIAANQYLVFYRTETGLAFNNNGDRARLIAPDGKVSSEISYSENASEGVAYARDTDNSWKWTTKPTPGAANIIVSKQTDDENDDSSSNINTNSNSDKEEKTPISHEISIAEAREKEKNTQVKVRGIVTVEPKLLGEKIFYIQDNTAGIQIYFSKEDFPSLKLGDEVTISGKVSENQNEKKINVQEKTDIKVIAHKSLPKPAEIKTGDVAENYEGELVQIAGKISKSSGNVFYVDDGSGEAKVYIKKTTGIKKPEIKKGDKITITGIVSETSSGYRVLPRYQEDIKFGLFSFSNINAKNAAAGRNVWPIFWLALAITFYVELPRLAYKFENEIKNSL